MSCPDSPSVAIEPTDPGSILDRLPAALFNRARPSIPFQPALRCGEAIYADTVFGPSGSDDATPQWEVARIMAGEKDQFLRTWAQCEALQHALGTSEEDVTTAPVARGADLDRWWAQYGIGRPSGFGDCCYHRLGQLLLFSPRGRWRLLEIAALYTGIRPAMRETPLGVSLTWQSAARADLECYACDDNAFFDAGFMDSEEIIESSADDGFFDDAATCFIDVDQAGEDLGIGLTLEQALDLVKSAGVHLELVNLPAAGWSGCAGETSRHASSAPGRWS